MAERLRECIDREIVRFSLQDLLQCGPCMRPLYSLRSLRYDARTKAAWRLGDNEAYSIVYAGEGSARHRAVRVAHLLLRGKNLNLSISPRSDIQGLVVYPRDSVIVTVAKSLDVAAKVLRRTAYGRNILENECLASRLLPEFVPPIVAHQDAADLGSHAYVVSRFAANSRPVLPSEWSTVLPVVIRGLLLCYERAGFRTARLDEVVAQAEDIIERRDDGSEFSRLSQQVIGDTLRVCLQFWGARVLTTFVHGDITRDAIHRDGDCIKIIDWGNAGWRSVFYDMFMQEFYQANPRFWGNLLGVRSVGFFSAYFCGAFPLFNEGISELTGANFSVFDIKAYMVVALLENSIDNWLRYRVVDEVEGIEYFDHIKKILKHLCVAY